MKILVKKLNGTVQVFGGKTDEELTNSTPLSAVDVVKLITSENLDEMLIEKADGEITALDYSNFGIINELISSVTNLDELQCVLLVNGPDSVKPSLSNNVYPGNINYGLTADCILKKFVGKQVHVFSTSTKESKTAELRVIDGKYVLFHQAQRKGQALVTTLVRKSFGYDDFRFDRGFVFNGSIGEVSEIVTKAGLDAVAIDLDSRTIRTSLFSHTRRDWSPELMRKNLSLDRKVIATNMPGKTTDVVCDITAIETLNDGAVKFSIKSFVEAESHAFHVVKEKPDLKEGPVQLDFEMVNAKYISTESAARQIDRLWFGDDCVIRCLDSQYINDEIASVFACPGFTICTSTTKDPSKTTFYHAFTKNDDGLYHLTYGSSLADLLMASMPKLTFDDIGHECGFALNSMRWLMSKMADGTKCILTGTAPNINVDVGKTVIYRKIDGKNFLLRTHDCGHVLRTYEIVKRGPLECIELTANLENAESVNQITTVKEDETCTSIAETLAKLKKWYVALPPK